MYKIIDLTFESFHIIKLVLPIEVQNNELPTKSC